MQDIVYMRLPPGINFGKSLKISEITQMGYFRVEILQKKSSLEHHTSCITHHTSHIADKFVIIIICNNDKNNYALPHFIKTSPKKGYHPNLPTLRLPT